MIGATSKNGAKRFVIGLVNLEVSLIELKLCEFRNELARERILKRLEDDKEAGFPLSIMSFTMWSMEVGGSF